MPHRIPIWAILLLTALLLSGGTLRAWAKSSAPIPTPVKQSDKNQSDKPKDAPAQLVDAGDLSAVVVKSVGVHPGTTRSPGPALNHLTIPTVSRPGTVSPLAAVGVLLMCLPVMLSRSRHRCASDPAPGH